MNSSVSFLNTSNGLSRLALRDSFISSNVYEEQPGFAAGLCHVSKGVIVQ